jgi:pyruvate ferredoxin oxidoreductase delta subunit
MDRPKIKPFKTPSNMSEIPFGSTFEAAHLVEGNAGWRTFRPVVDQEKCTGCLRCYLLCPDGVIYQAEAIEPTVVETDETGDAKDPGNAEDAKSVKAESEKKKPEMIIDYDFCKGCGICAHECKFDAITMEKEEL